MANMSALTSSLFVNTQGQQGLDQAKLSDFKMWWGQALTIAEDNGKDGAAAMFRNTQPILNQPTMADTLFAMMQFLVNESTEEEMETAQSSIGLERDRVAEKTKDIIDKIDKAIKEMEKAKKMNGFMKAFGWIGVALAVVAAVAVTVATGGLGAPAAVALFTAGVAVVMQSLDEAGVMEEFAKNNPDAFLAVMITVTAVTLIASLGVGAAGAFGLLANSAKVAATTAKTAQMVATVAELAAAATDIASGGVTLAKADHESNALEAQGQLALLQAQKENVKEMAEQAVKFLQMLIQRMQNSVEMVSSMAEKEVKRMSDFAEMT